MKELEKLYKLTKTGKIQVCNMSYEGNKYFVEHGQKDGKLRTDVTICTPKNVGRSNETTAEEQAKLECKAKHAQKIKSGYSKSPTGSTEVLLPMKVKKYQDNMNNVIFPCYVSLKLNGVNAIYRRDENNNLNLTSRGGLEYPRIHHLEPEVVSMMDKLNTNALAGELYIHQCSLQKITSLVKKTKPGSENLTFNIFDLPNHTGSAKDRFILLNNTPSEKNVKIVKHVIAKDHDDLKRFHNSSVHLDLEGIVINNSRGLYQYNVRSSDCFKYKVPKEDEFKIVGYNIDKSGFPVFVLETKDHKEFKAKPIGEAEDRMEMLNNIETEYIGKYATIEYEMLSDDNKPLKPIFIRKREVDNITKEAME